MELTNDRLKHCKKIAERMMEYVKTHTNIFTCKPEEMYILGLFHDIGYAFVDKQVEHEHVGGYLLKTQGYKYWKEVYYHGDPLAEYDSMELRLLNFMDITTGPTGEIMTIDERIEDIKKRYGDNSVQTLKAIALADKIMRYSLPD